MSQLTMSQLTMIGVCIGVSGVASFAIGRSYFTTKAEVKAFSEMRSDLEKTNASLDETFQTKDMLRFVRTYEEASHFAVALQDETDTRYLIDKSYLINSDEANQELRDIKHAWGSSLSSKLTDSSQTIFPVVYDVLTQNPVLLENWPTECSGDDVTTEYTNALIAFGQEKIGTAYNGENKDWLFETIFSEDVLEASRVAQTLRYAVNRYESEPEGRYAPFSYRVPAQAFTFALLDVTEIGLPEGTIDYACNIIDLGADGIDACDARINGIAPEQISQANETYKKCMELTTTRLRERYPTEI